MRYFDDHIIKMAKIVTISLGFLSLILLFAIFVKRESVPEQKYVETKIDITNRINICLPETEDNELEIEYF